MRENERGRKTNVIFFGANFNDEFPVKNLYKALNVAKPDMVMVQLSPNYLLEKFQQRPVTFDEESKEWKFNNEKYLD